MVDSCKALQLLYLHPEVPYYILQYAYHYIIPYSTSHFFPYLPQHSNQDSAKLIKTTFSSFSSVILDTVTKEDVIADPEIGTATAATVSKFMG